jgi:endonuclease/exonuclease/phosphatase family metal-dependent hydrolase
MSITVATYNVLADSYVRPSFYPDVPPERFDRARRRDDVVAAVAALDVDVLCLQEAEVATFAALQRALAPLGYVGLLATKTGRTEGCAAFVRRPAVTLTGGHASPFRDGSGHVAQVLFLEHEGRPLGVVNTHLKWAPSDASPEQQHGARQGRQLVAELAEVGPRCPAWVVCGDLNADAASPVLRAFFDAGLLDAFATLPDAFTCVANGRARRIDFLLHSPALNADPLPPPPLDDATVLPSESEPSDHVPIAACFRWADAPLPAPPPPR